MVISFIHKCLGNKKIEDREPKKENNVEDETIPIEKKEIWIIGGKDRHSKGKERSNKMTRIQKRPSA